LAGSASPRGDTRLAAARAQSSCGTGIVTPTGQIGDPVRVPKATISGGVNYEYPVAAWNASVVPSVNVVYTSKQQVGASNTSFYRNSAGVLNIVGDGTFITGAESRAHTIVNASLALTADDKSWTSAIECSNCFDVAYPQSAASNLNYFNAPRTWQIKVRRSF
jgi:iron complex outermembrane recepter protein